MAKTKSNVLVGVALLEIRYPVGGAYVEAGYTEDGVRLEYTSDTADIEVEEETVPIKRVITKEGLAVVCNMAESSMFNLDKAIAGSVMAGTVITIGAGAIKEMSIKLTGTAPSPLTTRVIEIPLATAVGAVALPYRKGTKTVVPVTFQALKGAAAACTITDS